MTLVVRIPAELVTAPRPARGSVAGKEDEDYVNELRHEVYIANELSPTAISCKYPYCDKQDHTYIFHAIHPT